MDNAPNVDQLSAHFFTWTRYPDRISGCAELSDFNEHGLGPIAWHLWHAARDGRFIVVGRTESRMYRYSNPVFCSEGEIGGWVYVDVDRPQNTITIFND